MADDEWDTIENDAGRFRWVYNKPNGAQHLGATLHKTRSAAIRAGKTWLAAKGTH